MEYAIIIDSKRKRTKYNVYFILNFLRFIVFSFCFK